MKKNFLRLLILSLTLNVLSLTQEAKAQSSDVETVVSYLDSLDEETRLLIPAELFHVFYNNPETYSLVVVKNFIEDLLKESGEAQEEQVAEVSEEELNRAKIQGLLDALSDIERQVMPKNQQEIVFYYPFEEAKAEINYWKRIAANRIEERKESFAYIETLDEEVRRRLESGVEVGGHIIYILEELADYSNTAPPLGYVVQVVGFVERMIKIEEENARYMAEMEVEKNDINSFLNSLDPEVRSLIPDVWVQDWLNMDYGYDLDVIKTMVEDIVNAPKPPKLEILGYSFNNKGVTNQRVLPVFGFKVTNIDMLDNDPGGSQVSYECQMRIIGTDDWFNPPQYTLYRPQDVWGFYYGSLMPYEVRCRIVDWTLIGEETKMNGPWSDTVQLTRSYNANDVIDLITNGDDPEFYGSRPMNVSGILDLKNIFTNIISMLGLWGLVDDNGFDWERGDIKSFLKGLPELTGRSPQEFVDEIKDLYENYYEEGTYEDIIIAIEVFYGLPTTASDEFRILFGM